MGRRETLSSGVVRRRNDFADSIENHGNLQITINQIVENSKWQDDAWSKLQGDYQSLKEDYASQFEKVTRIIRNLEESLNSLTEESKSKFDTVGMLKKVHDFQNRIAETDAKSRNCIEAAQWLAINRDNLVEIACQELFDNQLKFRGSSHLGISQIGYDQFRQDLDVYLKWISHYLRLCMNPRPFKEGLVFSPIEYRFYQEAFLFMVNSKVVHDAAFSDGAYEMLASYFNRFLIDRTL